MKRAAVLVACVLLSGCYPGWDDDKYRVAHLEMAQKACAARKDAPDYRPPAKPKHDCSRGRW